LRQDNENVFSKELFETDMTLIDFNDLSEIMKHKLGFNKPENLMDKYYL
jgi:hypothetical protein